MCLLKRLYPDTDEELKHKLLGELRKIVSLWIADYLICNENTSPSNLMDPQLADLACERLSAAITAVAESDGDSSVQVLLDPCSPTGSTSDVHFTTAEASLWRTDPRKCHINYVWLDNDREEQFCRIAEEHPRVRAYVKNQNLGLEVPYRVGVVSRSYLPDFIVLVDDGDTEPLHLIVEINGYNGEDARIKHLTMEKHWVPGINSLTEFGRWGFAEFTDVQVMEDLISQMTSGSSVAATKSAVGLAHAGGSEPELEYIPRRRSEFT